MKNFGINAETSSSFSNNSITLSTNHVRTETTSSCLGCLFQGAFAKCAKRQSPAESGEVEHPTFTWASTPSTHPIERPRTTLLEQYGE